MKYEFHFLILLVGIGLLTKRLNWKGWFFVALFVFSFVMFNWKKG